MSLNVTVVTHEFIACATDRRVTTHNKVLSERSCKLIQFDCGGARGLISYNGVGRSVEGLTPIDWFEDVLKVGACDLEEFCRRIKIASDPHLARVAPQFSNNPRHTFVVGAMDHRGIPVLGLVSNYEHFDKDDVGQAAGELHIELRRARRETPFGILATGATNLKTRAAFEALRAALAKGRNQATILKRMIKVVRDTAYNDLSGGTVGNSVLTSVLDRSGNFQMGSDVVGGSVIQESPDYIGVGFQFRNMWMAGMQSGEKFPGGVEPPQFAFEEPGCPACGTPVPIGYRKCGGCGTKVTGAFAR